jgi:hypothetical protein
MNPDEGQDIDLIEQKLTPVFELLGQLLTDITTRLGELESKFDRLTGGFSDAVTAHRRGALSDEIMGQYGEELQPFDSFRSETGIGSKLSDEIIDALMSDEGIEDRDSFIRSKIDGDKGKYGKFLGMSVEAKPLEGEETPAEEKAEEAIEAPAEEEKKEEAEGGSPFDHMAEILGTKKKQ